MRHASFVLVLGLAFAIAPAHSEPDDSPVLVVIDPGHGGSNTGAPAHDGGSESRLTLEISVKLAAQLKARGLEVVLTRERDRYMTLRQRSDIANRLGADVFVSVHANASPDHSHAGFETYLLSPKALDVDARALRTEIAPNTPQRIRRLIDDVERGTAHPKAAVIAAAIQKQLKEARPNSPNRGVKQESMHVLLGAKMPAVLVEVGFHDHPREGPELADSAVQTRIAGAIASAIAETAR